MALTKDAKLAAVEKVKTLLAGSKLTVVAKYSGTSVKELQNLRQAAKENDSVVLIVKNRLFKKALEAAGHSDLIEQMPLSGQLMYVFNKGDESAAAQVLANFAKTNPQIEFVSGINDQWQVLPIEDLQELANLPSKEQLRAQLIAMVKAPASGLVSVLAAVNCSVLNVLSARAESTT